MTLDALRYPIGKFEKPESVSAGQIARWIDDLEHLPHNLRATVSGYSKEQFDTPYRPEGWTVRQVIHHLVDSHINSLVRFKWALTEDRPLIKTYDEVRWAELEDHATAPEPSLDLLEALHVRWAIFLRTLDAEDHAREFIHPESGPIRVDANIGAYVWHGRHHLAHITSLAKRNGWA